MMDRTLGYLRESLSNHLEHDVCRGIYKKLQVKHYANEGEFVKDRNDLELDALNQVLVLKSLPAAGRLFIVSEPVYRIIQPFV